MKHNCQAHQSPLFLDMSDIIILVMIFARTCLSTCLSVGLFIFLLNLPVKSYKAWCAAYI
jgi:hypothetical protein